MNSTVPRAAVAGVDLQDAVGDEVMLDVAGNGDETLVCRKGRTRLVTGVVQAASLPKGTTPGLCAWKAAAPNQP